ncbi:hypothetical protein CONSTELLA_54 [Mycobacterium phage Constella]|nr:hypothetical protein CONSTELLA_54 [Mycobacterium phage Constella]
MSELDEWIEDILRSNPRPSFIDDGASECIARTLRNLSAMGGHSLNTLKAVGDVILADLYARGYAVVKLPKPVGVNGEDDAVWLKAPYIEPHLDGWRVVE